MGRLVVPGLVGVAGFHGREDMDQARMVAALREHARHNISLLGGKPYHASQMGT